MSGPIDAGAGTGLGWMAGDALAYHAAVRPGGRACLDLRTGEALSFAELDVLAGRCAGLLGALLGDPIGQRVASVLRNGIDALVLMYACERAGAIYTPLNWRLTAHELGGVAADCEPGLLVVDAEFEGAARQAFAPNLAVLVADGGDGGFRGAALACAPEPARARPADEPSVMLYTSGTTGQPKGVPLTRANLFWAAFNFAIVGEVGPQSVMLCDTPMFHTVGLVAICRCALQQGGSVLLSDAFRSDASLRRLGDPALGISHYFGVPQMAQALCDDPAFAETDLSRLKGLFLGGAPMPGALHKRLMDRDVLVVNGYGMTETSTISGMPVDARVVRKRPASVGLAAPAAEVRIVTAEGRDAVAGELGEIWVRGPSVTPGYWRQPEATAAAFVDGWFRTGDAGVFDEGGFLTIVDRWKDMYISGGENVYPAEVEVVIAALPGIRAAAVVGVPSDRWGEAGCAFVVGDAAGAPSAAAILAHCRARLAPFKLPTDVRFIDTLPLTDSGKIRKDLLRHEAVCPGSLPS